MRIALVAMLCLFLTACPSVPHVKEAGFTEETLNKDGTKVVRTMTKEAQFNSTVLQIAQVPLFSMECPPAGCVFTKLAVAQPLGGQLKEMLVQPKEPTPELHPAAQVIREFFQPLERLALAVGPALIVGNTAKAGFSALSNMGSAMAGQIQAPAGTSVVITGSSGVGVLGGNGSTSSVDSHNVTTNTSTITTDNSQRWALDIACTFAATTGSPPAYCSQR